MSSGAYKSHRSSCYCLLDTSLQERWSHHFTIRLIIIPPMITQRIDIPTEMIMPLMSSGAYKSHISQVCTNESAATKTQSHTFSAHKSHLQQIVKQTHQTLLRNLLLYFATTIIQATKMKLYTASLVLLGAVLPFATATAAAASSGHHSIGRNLGDSTPTKSTRNTTNSSRSTTRNA